MYVTGVTSTFYSGILGVTVESEHTRVKVVQVLTRIDDPKTSKEQKELDQALVMCYHRSRMPRHPR